MNSTNENISLKDFFWSVRNMILYLKTKWIIIFIVGFIGGCFGFIYAYMQKPQYLATLNFALEDEKSGSGGMSGALGLASSLGFDLGGSAGGAFSGANLIQLMKSRRIVEQSLLNTVSYNGRQITLAEMYIQINGWRTKWQENHQVNEQLQFLPNADRSKFVLQQDSILGNIYSRILKENLYVDQRDKKISIITIDVKSENELFAKYFAEVLAKEVSDFYVETKSRKSKLNVGILERQTDSIRTALNNAITGVAVANDNTFNLNQAMNLQRTPSSKRQIDVQANTAILTQLVANLEMARVSLRKETPLIQIIDKPILPLERQKKSKSVTAIQFSLFFVLICSLFIAVRKYSIDFFNVTKPNQHI